MSWLGVFVLVPFYLTALLAPHLSEPLQTVLLYLPLPVTFAALFFKRAATFKLTPATLQVSAWAGRVPRPVRHTFTLKGLRLTHKQLGSHPDPTGPRLRQLTIASPEQDMCITGLVVDQQTINTLVRSVERTMSDAQALIGEGEAEVPDDLRSLLRSKEQER